MTRLLYTAAIPESALQDNTGRTTGQRELAKLASLSREGSVTPTGSRPNEVSLSGKFTARYADLATLELLELFDASDFDALPFADSEGEAPDDGYYVVENPDAGRVQPQSDIASTYSATLVREGTQSSHHRRLQSPTTSVTHQFGQLDFVPYGIHSDATRVRWLDSETTEATAASPARTLAAEGAQVDHYDLSDAPYDDPQLTWTFPLHDGVGEYRSPYAKAGDIDVAVFDTWGNPEFDTDGRFSWQQVYSSDHDYRGDLVIENGFEQFRVKVGDDPPGLTLDRYRNGSWGRASFGSSDWQLFDIDVYRIAAPQVRAETTWEDSASGDLHTLEMVLPRGWQEALFFEPADADGALLQDTQAPQGLVDLLDPIAAETRIDPDPRQGLIARQDIPY
jgi:hypothetical protein